MGGECEQNAEWSRIDSGNGSSGTAAGSINKFVSRLSWKEIEIKCARWIYGRALPLTTTESEEFKPFCRSLSPAYTPPSRFFLAGVHLKREFKAIAGMVNEFFRRNVSDSDVVVGDDGWSDRLRNSIYNVILFVPEPLYVETKVRGEEKHIAANTASFYATRIEALGPRNVCAFLSDTENKMKAVWDMLLERSCKDMPLNSSLHGIRTGPSPSLSFQANFPKK